MVKVNLTNDKSKIVKASLKRSIDILFLVPGTTDPINTDDLEHQSNKMYWYKKDKDGNFIKSDFIKSIESLTDQFPNLKIQKDYFSWTGDNTIQKKGIKRQKTF